MFVLLFYSSISSIYCSSISFISSNSINIVLQLLLLLLVVFIKVSIIVNINLIDSIIIIISSISFSGNSIDYNIKIIIITSSTFYKYCV